MATICNLGTEVDMSALPSLVQTTQSPVAATPKLQPVSPASASIKSPRKSSRAQRVR